MQENTKPILQLPLPVPDPFHYQLVQAQGFAKYPERLRNFIKAKSQLRTEVIGHLPTRLDIEPNSRCNFRCTMCAVSKWPKGTRAGDMSFEQFKKIIDEQTGLVEIKVQGMGEPLLHPDIFKMMSYASERYIWTRTTVNGSRLHVKENYKQLIDSGIHDINISVDGASKEVFEAIRVGSHFETIVENLKLLNNYANRNNLLRTRMWSLIQAGNFHQLKELIDLAAAVSFRRLTFSFGIGDWGDENWKEPNANKRVNWDSFLLEAPMLMDHAKRSGVELTFWNINEKFSAEKTSTLCMWPFERAYISSDMRIVPCCMIGVPEVADLGDASNLLETWNGPLYREFRKSHIEGRVPSFCDSCYEKPCKN